MRREDLETLGEPYEQPVQDGSDQFRQRLGIDCPEVARLGEAILADLDPQVFGVRWWAAQLRTKRRILISDCLYQAIESIDDNLSEGQLHLLQLQYWQAEESRQNADTIYADPTTGQARVRNSPPKSALDQVPSAMSTLHVVGSLQAMNTALDCLAGGIVGVCALALDLQRASYGGVTSFLAGRTRPKPNGAQVQFGHTLAKRVADSGPSGWLDWMRAFRNANLHRGRRLQAKHLTQRRPVIFGPTGEVIPRADTTLVLPAEPGFSEIEALLSKRPLQLAEPALTTLKGCLSSTRELIRAAASDLLAIWLRRRADPSWLVQPDSQWESVQVSDGTHFEGYEPGTASAFMPTMFAHPSYSRRLHAAALESAIRHRWDDEFD
jgi:hypothetical protein